MFYWNAILIIVIILVALMIIYYVFRKADGLEEESSIIDVYSIPYLIDGIKQQFNEIINRNIAQLYLNRSETQKREQQKARLSSALRSCAQGNIGEKEFVKDYIRDLLQRSFDINEGTIDKVINFDVIDCMTYQDKFDFLLYIMKKEYGRSAFDRLCGFCGFDEAKCNEQGTYYEITNKDIDRAFAMYYIPLGYIDKLELITQRIYQQGYGFSVIDELRDMDIDGISGGVSGISSEQYNYLEEVLKENIDSGSRTYDSIWVFLHGKAIHLSFLSFGNSCELIRVCKNLYSYDNIGHLTSSNGYKLTYQYDGSRVVVVRPKLASHWAFFLRKYSSVKCFALDSLFQDKGNDAVVEILKWSVKGCLNIILSGDQNSGKTTALKALIRYIDQRYPIRTTEAEFELWLNNSYPELNVVGFRSSDEVSIIEAINIQKKTDAAIMILGEVASLELASAYIALTQAGTKATICTCHCVSTDDLVDYFRNSVLSVGTFSNEMIAEEQVANSINLDIHFEKASDGKRYISYIREIIPYPRDDALPEDTMECIAECLKRMSRKRAFYSRDLIVYEDGRYILKNRYSNRLYNKILKNLSEEDRKSFIAFSSLA